MSEQMSLWDRPSLDPVSRVKEAMRKALKACPLSREQVVERMNDLARVEGLSTNGRAGKTTPEILDKWVSQSGDHTIPWKLLPVFCQVTGSVEPLAALAAPVKAVVIAGDDIMLLRWARAEMESRKLKKMKRKLEAEILP